MVPTFFGPTEADDIGDPQGTQFEAGELEDAPFFSAEVLFLRAHLSVAEEALRQASGEKAPVKCWGCQDVDEYKLVCYHRFSDCPNKEDPRVQENFHRALQEFRNKRFKGGNGSGNGRHNSASKNPRAMMTAPEVTAAGFPGKEVATFVAAAMADPNLQQDDRERIANGFASALVATKPADELSPEESQKQAKAMLASFGITEVPRSKSSSNFRVFMVQVSGGTTATSAVGHSIFPATVISTPKDWASKWKERLSDNMKIDSASAKNTLFDLLPPVSARLQSDRLHGIIQPPKMLDLVEGYIHASIGSSVFCSFNPTSFEETRSTVHSEKFDNLFSMASSNLCPPSKSASLTPNSPAEHPLSENSSFASQGDSMTSNDPSTVTNPGSKEESLAMVASVDVDKSYNEGRRKASSEKSDVFQASCDLALEACTTLQSPLPLQSRPQWI